MTALDKLRTGIDDVITCALSENRIVGTVVLIARDGEPVYERAAGFADREAAREMGVETLFRLSSVTKAIVCAAAMAHVERNELALDSSVERWLPEFRPKLPSGEAPEITVRQLLTHTAGLDQAWPVAFQSSCGTPSIAVSKTVSHLDRLIEVSKANSLVVRSNNV